MFLNRVSYSASKKNLTALFLAALLALATKTAYAAEAGRIIIDLSIPVLPAVTGLTLGVGISLPDEAPDGIFEAEVSAESGWGVLLFEDRPSASGKVRVSKGLPARVEYRWSGLVQPDAPSLETIKAEIPALGISGERNFNVGMDLRIKEIAFPGQLESGIFNAVEIVLEDTFNPLLDVAGLLRSLDIKPEVSMSLSFLSDDGAETAEDPVVGAFFEHMAEDGEQTYPGRDLIPGSVISQRGEFLWRSGEGKPTGITPPPSGRYSIEAVLKSNLGGPPMKIWSSPALGAAAGNAPRTDLPGLAGSTVAIISRLDANSAAEAETAARRFLDSGDANGAAALGSLLRKSFGTSFVAPLGRFASALAASDRETAEIIDFLEAIIKGFGDSGVLLFTRSGVAEWSLSSGAAAFGSERYVAVPFSDRQNIRVTLTGAHTDDVSLWKLIPAGTNTKLYEAGDWIMEVTVFTAEVIPPN